VNARCSVKHLGQICTESEYLYSCILGNSTRRHSAPSASSGARGGASGAIVAIAKFEPRRLQRKHLI
jgi:hypothetical protein